MKALMSVSEAATEVSMSVSTIRRAIRKTKPDDNFPPMLPAKKVGGAYRVAAAALTAWIEALPDA